MPDLVIIPPTECVMLAPTAPGFAHGFGLFETMRYDAGRLYFWQDHWARLTRSARHFTLDLPAEAAVLRALRQLVTSAAMQSGILKLSLLKHAEGSCLYVYARPPLPAPDRRCLRLDTDCPIGRRSLLAGHKTHNYMEAMCLLQRARERGYYDALRLDDAGMLAETTTANLFFVRDGRLYTPALDTGILPGVTRAALLRATELGIVEGRFTPDDLFEAEAVFVTNATHGVQIVEGIDGFSGGRRLDLTGASQACQAIESVLVRAQAERAYQLI
ncbi:aminotransferase class IV [Coraliomargarita sp. SDUM461004]|uniref:branched-chain-amino-acid transaminase n=1 Tax=Thalassobacterium sedimentorum TaxID=3041258 RepID=A0ABU1AIL5_9BACT|nr:aminotransferase class IV [Coraliomargarita sp. SDUM461004]MDQ8194013.1 aminotransferase class IV [Coraliomargarita sp. SDUM461004]